MDAPRRRVEWSSGNEGPGFAGSRHLSAIAARLLGRAIEIVAWARAVGAVRDAAGVPALTSPPFLGRRGPCRRIRSLRSSIAEMPDPGPRRDPALSARGMARGLGARSIVGVIKLRGVPLRMIRRSRMSGRDTMP